MGPRLLPRTQKARALCVEPLQSALGGTKDPLEVILMKMRSLLAVLAMALLFGTWAPAQSGKGKILPNDVTITDVESVMSFETNLVTIRGTNLALVNKVLVRDLMVPIVSKSGTQLVIRTEPTDPGFAGITLFYPGGQVACTLEFTPTVLVRRHSNRVQVTVHSGEPGFYWVYYSYKRLAQPYAEPGVWYMRLIDLAEPYGGLLAVGHTREEGPVDLPWQVVPPAPIGWTDMIMKDIRTFPDLNVQAYFVLEESGLEDYACYSNMAPIPFPCL
jgi:hypothetical protein